MADAGVLRFSLLIFIFYFFPQSLRSAQFDERPEPRHVYVLVDDHKNCVYIFLLFWFCSGLLPDSSAKEGSSVFHVWQKSRLRRPGINDGCLKTCIAVK